MNSEKIRILKMVEAGKLSPEEAGKLLEALSAPEAESTQIKKSGKPKFLKIRVYEEGKARPKVNVMLPLGLIRMLQRIVPESARIQLQEKNIDLDEIISMIDETTGGKILEVHDDEDGEHVEIVVE
jgi:hypothetical protein